MLKLRRSLFGAIIAVASIGANAQAITATAHPRRIQQIPLNLQAQFHHKASDGSSSFGDPARQIDRPAGFGTFNIQPRSLYPIDSPETSTKCSKGSAPDSGCNATTTSNERSPSKPTPAASNSLKNSPPVARQNSNSNNTLYRIRWSNSNKFKK